MDRTKRFFILACAIASLDALAKDPCGIGFAAAEDQTLQLMPGFSFYQSTTGVSVKQNGLEVATMSHSVSSSGILTITDSWVDEGFRRRGFYSKLYGYILRLKKPKAMKSLLDEDNAVAYTDGIMEGLSPIEALMRTPAYKASARSGFARVVVDEKEAIGGVRSHLPDYTNGHSQFPLRPIMITVPDQSATY